jgi:putative ABC transport system permease protein
MGGLPLHIDLTVRDGEFEPFSLEVRDSVTGISRTVTVVGILSSRIPANILTGVYVNADTYRRLYGEPDYRDWYLRLDDGIDSEAAAKDIKAALVTHGVEATSIDEMIDEMLATSRGFIRILQAFMSLGLLVGIASLGVIALRSVVERRQQIGMLRAIGYQRGTVALSFVLESGFVAMMGIVSGVVGATILSWNLLRSDAFASTSKITFFVPWGEIISYSLVAFAFALLMTWWPSTCASSVPVAEALRYE